MHVLCMWLSVATTYMYDFIPNNNLVGNKLGFHILNIKPYLYAKYCVSIRDLFKYLQLGFIFMGMYI